MSTPPTVEPRPASAALTTASGYLAGFTHTLQPYIGCAFGCSYCYVQGLPLHRCHRPPQPWGDYVHPRTGIAAKLAGELRKLEAAGQLATTAIFMSSATDPYQPAERTWRLSRACLDTLGEHPPGLLVIQTRSPLAEEDFDRMAAFGSRLWLNLTVETDRDDIRRRFTPRCASLGRRWQTAVRARAAGLQVQLTVSPCLPYSTVERFGALLLDHGDRVIVDSFASGDGSNGRRTAGTAAPKLFAPDEIEWQDESAAHTLYAWLRARTGEKTGWSQAGFTALCPPAL